ncbi:PREDICTED: maestro heat-like repeat family member 5 [Condylura cristata]|uniref:maestro heat-like repeat family member 5 n=1 Tax=Condylura cristata TaxID=143302 RepID=UPI000642DA78|nr:PREDICTED: maestro heat-like repeat family member 5 [Condylura cristata]
MPPPELRPGRHHEGHLRALRGPSVAPATRVAARRVQVGPAATPPLRSGGARSHAPRYAQVGPAATPPLRSGGARSHAPRYAQERRDAQPQVPSSRKPAAAHYPSSDVHSANRPEQPSGGGQLGLGGGPGEPRGSPELAAWGWGRAPTHALEGTGGRVAAPCVVKTSAGRQESPRLLPDRAADVFSPNLVAEGPGAFGLIGVGALTDLRYLKCRELPATRIYLPAVDLELHFDVTRELLRRLAWLGTHRGSWVSRPTVRSVFGSLRLSPEDLPVRALPGEDSWATECPGLGVLPRLEREPDIGDRPCGWLAGFHHRAGRCGPRPEPRGVGPLTERSGAVGALERCGLTSVLREADLDEAYQDAASNVLVAICKHAWRAVASRLEAELLTGVFPHRSFLYVMGVLSSSDQFSSQDEKVCWDQQLLKVLLDKEPQDTLCTASRQQAICLISSLCDLRPPPDLEMRSRLLSTCFRSVLSLPLLDVLEKHTCLFLEPPNVQELYARLWEALDQMLQDFLRRNPTAGELHLLLSKAHERQRAVRSCTGLLKFLNHRLLLDPKEDFKRTGQLLGMLGILCRDPDQATQRASLEGVGHLYQLLLRQRGEEPPEVTKQLTVTELMDLAWTAVDGLGATSPFCVRAAAEALLAVVQEHGAQLETVAHLGRAIHLRLCSVRIPQAKENTLRAITLLARSHASELVTTFLDISIALDSHALCLWRALGAELHMSHQVLAMLLGCLRERPLPTGAGSPPKEKPYLRSLAVSYKLDRLHPDPRAPRWAPRDAGPVTAPRPHSTSLEALKSLLSTTGHWQDFAHLELQSAWELLAAVHTYPQGVGLLARAMVQNSCRQIKAVTVQLLPQLQSPEGRERRAAVLVLMEFLYSPALLDVLPRDEALTLLSRSLWDPDPQVRVWSLQGLGNILFHPEKVGAASDPSSSPGAFEDLKADPEPGIREFASRQLAFLQEVAGATRQ